MLTSHKLDKSYSSFLQLSSYSLFLLSLLACCGCIFDVVCLSADGVVLLRPVYRLCFKLWGRGFEVKVGFWLVKALRLSCCDWSICQWLMNLYW